MWVGFLYDSVLHLIWHMETVQRVTDFRAIMREQIYIRHLKP